MPLEPSASDFFESPDFWDEHKNKIIAYAILVVLALGGYGVYAIVTQRKTAEAQSLYAQAKTVADLQTVVHDYAGTRVAGDAALELADKLRAEKKYDEAVTVLRDFIAKYPEHPLLSGAWTSLAATYELQGKLDEALDAYQQVASKYPEAYTTPIAMASQARILSQKGKKDEARNIYQNIVAQYHDSIFAREAMRELRFLKQ